MARTRLQILPWPRQRITALIYRSVLWYFGIASLVVLFLLAIGQLKQILQQVAAGQLPLEMVLQLLGLSLPTLLVMVIPLALYFAVYLVFSNLYRNHEMMAIQGAGIGLGTLLRGLLGIIVLIVLLEALLALWWAPQSQWELQQEASRLAAAAAQSLIRPGNFADLPGGHVIYVGQQLAGQDRYREIFLDLSRANVSDYATAAFGEIRIAADGTVSLVLIDGKRYLGQPGTAGYKIWSFSHYRVALAGPTQHSSTDHSWASRSLPQLFADLSLVNQRRHAQAELEWRLFWPLLIPLVVLLAIPLAHAEPRRQGRSGGLLAGVVLLVGANNLLIALKENLIQGKIAPLPGLFLVLLLLGGIAGYCFHRRRLGLPLLPRVFQGVFP
ncbi:MAG: LPS export ABC transporter permease LptF [Acidithiobacillus sp.]|nr:LPS export ABC transporter permease LptF [Acidithiobacillus sp.]